MEGEGVQGGGSLPPCSEISTPVTAARAHRPVGGGAGRRSGLSCPRRRPALSPGLWTGRHTAPQLSDTTGLVTEGSRLGLRSPRFPESPATTLPEAFPCFRFRLWAGPAGLVSVRHCSLNAPRSIRGAANESFLLFLQPDGEESPSGC